MSPLERAIRFCLPALLMARRMNWQLYNESLSYDLINSPQEFLEDLRALQDLIDDVYDGAASI
jgi:hypothetical protein